MKESKSMGESIKVIDGQFDMADFANLIDKRDAIVEELLVRHDEAVENQECLATKSFYLTDIKPLDDIIISLGNDILREKYGVQADYQYIGEIYEDSLLDDWYNKCAEGEVERTFEL